ncbi:MAG TPA: YidC/Oxa1 family membrane protein insertase [Candidatus Saccharimonadia bacterium]|jgi:YidC/Oxa1 family membrane protein insertase|nr:YidC/Oxa1 family membrane protein insertase [Candidatus Saccharimonadia bacterium]
MFNTILVHPIFNLLAVLYAFVHDFGLAVVLLTIIIRGLLWPLVTRQLHSQRALQELQPELKRIKAEAAGDRTLEGKLTMELYKEREINPFASFLPLLIQLPIFLALFIVLKDIVKAGEIAKVAYEPVKHLPAIAEIINHHATFKPTLFGVIDLTKTSPILAVLAGLVQFIQTKQIAPKNQGGDAQAQMMAGMTYVFPALTFFIGLSLPGALPLYWFTSSAMAVIQQHIVLNRDVRELEEGTPTPAKAIAKPAAPAPHRGHKSKGKRKK